MSGGSATSAKFAAEHRAVMGILRVTDFSQALELIDIYKAQAKEDGWEAASDRFMVGVPTAVADTFEEAKEVLNNYDDLVKAFENRGYALKNITELVISSMDNYEL